MNFIKNYFQRSKIRKEKRQEKVDQLVQSYEDLIQEYRWIQEKKSLLSKKRREFVVYRINHLIYRGHIKIKA